jgi:hypothetical protein
MNAKSTRAGLIHESQAAARRSQRAYHLGHRFQITGDYTVVTDFASAPLFGERDVDRFLVDIHPHEHATFRHGLPPLCVALRVSFIGRA